MATSSWRDSAEWRTGQPPACYTKEALHDHSGADADGVIKERCVIHERVKKMTLLNGFSPRLCSFRTTQSTKYSTAHIERRSRPLHTQELTPWNPVCRARWYSTQPQHTALHQHSNFGQGGGVAGRRAGSSRPIRLVECVAKSSS